MRTKYTKELLEPLVNESTHMSDLLRKLGLTTSGGNFNTIKDRLNMFNIDTGHFKRQTSSNKGKHISIISHTRESFIKKYLIDKHPIASTKLKKFLIKFKLLSEECSECGLLPEWNGKKLVLQLDHIDGNRNNNYLDNLRILCPNCHTQTETFSGRNSRISTPVKKSHKKIKVIKRCKECGIIISKKAKRCIMCAHKHRREILEELRKSKNYPNKESLYNLLKTNSFVQVGKLYNVSDNAVRKWCKSYKIPHKSSYYRDKYSNIYYYYK